ncbi:MAG: hypothetical protein M1835_000159 [Candelina submexicana]|nr:MAG: hypothetical protein M1835_000159 [Candelina submexicana]
MWLNIRFNVYTVCLAILLFLAGSRASTPSPSASVDLICHTSQQSDCYPRIFQPTTSFQRVHDDQDLPPGLHIRVNLETGLKEARLNVPFPGDEQQTELAAVPVSSDEDVVDDYPPGKSLVEQSGKKTPPAYSNEGKIQQPPATSGEESEIFTASISTILSPISSAEVVEAALDKLEDLAHEIYWGVEIAKDEATVRKLVSLLEDNSSAAKTALVLGSAVQNNAVALTAALSHFDADPGREGPLQMVLRRLHGNNDPKLSERLLYLLSAIMRGGSQRQQFVQSNALETLLDVFKAEGTGKDGYDGVRGRVALLLMDNFFTHQMMESHTAEDEPSLLTGEGPYVVGDLKTEQMILDSSMKTDEVFQPWCRAFAIALGKWEKQSISNEAMGYARVDEAYNVMKKELSRQSTSC